MSGRTRTPATCTSVASHPYSGSVIVHVLPAASRACAMSGKCPIRTAQEPVARASRLKVRAMARARRGLLAPSKVNSSVSRRPSRARANGSSKAAESGNQSFASDWGIRAMYSFARVSALPQGSQSSTSSTSAAVTVSEEGRNAPARYTMRSPSWRMPAMVARMRRVVSSTLSPLTISRLQEYRL